MFYILALKFTSEVLRPKLQPFSKPTSTSNVCEMDRKDWVHLQHFLCRGSERARGPALTSINFGREAQRRPSSLRNKQVSLLETYTLAEASSDFMFSLYRQPRGHVTPAPLLGPFLMSWCPQQRTQSSKPRENNFQTIGQVLNTGFRPEDEMYLGGKGPDNLSATMVIVTLSSSILPVPPTLSHTGFRGHGYSPHFHTERYGILKNTVRSLTKELKPLGLLYFKNTKREIALGRWRKKIRKKNKNESVNLGKEAS